VYNVPTARSYGVEAELFARPTPNWDFGISATALNAKLTSSVTVPVPSPVPGAPPIETVVGGLQDGARLPTAPQVQGVASAFYTLPLQNSKDFFTGVTVQYVGSSFSQFENEVQGFGEIGGATPGAARLIQYGGPLTTAQINFNAELPSYTLVNFRFGLKSDRWQTAAYVNNLANKATPLALDYERGRSARVGYLMNQPRTYGVYGSYSF